MNRPLATSTSSSPSGSVTSAPTAYACGATSHALGGTVTRTASTRFGELAGPEHSVDVEIRASWTAEDGNLDRHLTAWLDVLGSAAGLPPPGVRLLGPSGPQDDGTP